LFEKSLRQVVPPSPTDWARKPGITDDWGAKVMSNKVMTGNAGFSSLCNLTDESVYFREGTGLGNKATKQGVFLLS
jgi:hypothetical protein